MTRILIADDNEQNLYMLQVLLTGHGYQVVSTDNGAKALDIARRDPPDMIITDIFMPVMDGFALCRAWKNDPQLKAIPFIFYTATYTDPKDEEFALGLGAERFIIKPTEPEELISILQEIIAEYEAGQLAAGLESTDSNEAYLAQYNQTLIRKLEAKVVELRASNEALQLKIDEHIRAEQALYKANRAYRTLSECNQILIRAESIPALLQAICQSIVETSGYRMVWVGFAGRDEARTVQPMAYAGHEAGYLDAAMITWDDSERGRAPTGTAIRTGGLVTARDIATDPDYEPWRVEARKRGYASNISLPLIVRDQVVGALSIYAGEPDAFDRQEIDLLTELAGDLAFGIETLRTREERAHAQEALAQERNLLEERVIERTAQLNHAKERTEAILNSSNDIMILCLPSGKIDQVNPIFDTTLQRDADQVHNQPLTSLVAPQDVLSMEKAFAAVVQSGQPSRLEATIHGAPPITFEADVVLSPIVEYDRQISGVICSLRDITSRKEMESQLRQMLEHEMKLSELKSRYVSMAAHDLRNPLAVIQSSISLIHKYGDRLPADKLDEKFRHIQTNIKVMVEMLDDILTLGKTESGKLTFDPAPLDVIAFCENIVAEATQAAITLQSINLTVQGDCGTAVLDAKLLRHILGNLLSNAIKYSPEDRPVTLAVRCRPDRITFRVQDQGIGIPEDDQQRLFETFHRASNARQMPGTGLGLAIVKQSVELHGGTITFESEEGRGTAFTVVIPQTPLG